MSGDVQPKKRKDKKRRKDDGEQVPIQTHVPLLTTNVINDDVNIHVHKESGTGGGICAKFVFFILFSALAVLIGLIITEHRGLTDLDSVDTESKYSQIFEGWVDTNAARLDNHDVEKHEEPQGEHEHDDGYDHEEEENMDSEDDEHEQENEPSNEDGESAAEEDEEGSKFSDEASNEEEQEDENDNDEDDYNSVDESEERVVDEEENDSMEASEEETDQDDRSYENDSKEKEVDDEEQDIDSDEENNEEDEQNEDDDKDFVDLNYVDNNDDGEDEEPHKADKDLNMQSEEKIDASVEKTREEKRSPKQSSREVEEKQELDGYIQESAGDINFPPNTNEETDSDRESDDSTGYENINITNKDDYHIKRELDESQKHVENNSSYAIKLFDQILQKYPSSPRSLYGKALALDNLADQRKSNTLLNQGLKLYIELLNTANVPDALFEIAANRCIHRMRFIGQYNNLINIHNLVINRFSDNPKHLNDLAVTLLTINRVEDARKVLEKVLSKWPQNGFALVHYGFILKTTDNKLEDAVYYLKSGINTNEVGVNDGRFFFHLGDALSRLGRTDEAIEVYKEGANNKVFLSTFQRSLYNVPRLTGKPWWDIEDLPFLTLFKTLKQYWKTIRDEGLSVLNQEGFFKDETENLRDTGSWKQFELYARGQKNRRNCNKCPFTCSLIDKFPEARGCKRGQTKFSVMHPKTHVWPHSGPTNCRLRTHLGLKVPANTYIRVVDDIRSWKEGEIIVFDDSFEHEVWHNGTDFRLVLIVDVWHPELTPSEKSSISPI